MSRVVVAVCAWLGAACVGPPTGAAVDGEGGSVELWQGGSVVAPGCGDVVRLGHGATAPLVAGATVGPDPTPWQVHLGLTMDPRSSIAITWRTQDELTENTAVLVDGVRHPGVVWRHQDLEDRVAQFHEVHICGLAPDTTYSYRIEGDPAAETGRFRTAPDLAADPSAEVVALVFGDARGGADKLALLLAQADLDDAPDVLLFTGDAVVNGASQPQWDAFFAAGDALFRRVPVVAVIGNHEDGDIITFSSWAAPGNERWFSLDYGAAHLVLLDDSPWLSPDVDGHAADFLDADLPGAPAGAWKIVVHHQPMYSASLGHGSTVILRERWEGLLDRERVDLVLAGHNHNYERSAPLRAGEIMAAGAGTTYIVTAGSGAPLYPAGSEPWTITSASVYHTLTLRIRQGSITGQAVDIDGAVIDEFSLSR